jgi:hypothetical protein
VRCCTNDPVLRRNRPSGFSGSWFLGSLSQAAVAGNSLEALADPWPEKRAEAGRWLTALMKRALADELSGAALSSPPLGCEREL